MTTANKLNAIIDSKENIKNAIEAKGVTVGSAPLSQYAEKIGEIESGGDPNIFPPSESEYEQANTISAKYTIIDTEDYYSEIEVYSSNGTFNQLISSLDSGVFNSSGISERAKKVTLVNAKKTNVTFANMFELEEIVGLESVEILEQHSFRYCYNLYLDGNFPNVKRASAPFANYRNLPTNVNFPKIEIVNYDLYMSQCVNVRSITLGSPGFPFKTAGVKMFNGCSFLTHVVIYVENPSNPNLPGAPWGATNATITYLQA